MATRDRLKRVAMISVHTSPLDQPGTGDAGGLNVYVVETARQLAARGIAVEIFTRTTTAELPLVVDLMPGVMVRHITAGPYEGLAKDDLPGQLCAFAAGVMRRVAQAPEGWFDVVHSHYWLSGQVGWLAADRWQVPLVHTMHTMARVKNAHVADGDSLEPPGREIGEVQVVEAADRLVANTDEEAKELIELYDAPPEKVVVVPPGVDLGIFNPGDREAARTATDVRQQTKLLLFVGRIQPLKSPDTLVRAAAELVRRHPDWQDDLRVVILGGASGTGLAHPHGVEELAAELGIADRVLVLPPVSRPQLAQWYRAADVVAVPSYSESFGLVAVEAQACGTPVVATRVGGLPMSVGDAGILVDGHGTDDWADALESLVVDPDLRAELSGRAVKHSHQFGWDVTADRLIDVYLEAMAVRAANSSSALPTATA